MTKLKQSKTVSSKSTTKHRTYAHFLICDVAKFITGR